MNDPMLPLPGLDHGDDLRQILIQGRSDSVLLVAAPTGMEPVARKTAGFLASVQLSQLGAGNRQKTRCAYQCEIHPGAIFVGGLAPMLIGYVRVSKSDGSRQVSARKRHQRSMY